MAEASVLVISNDKDFALPLAEHVRNELSLPCVVAASKEAAKADISHALLVVTGEAGGETYPCPVLKLPTAPLRLQDVLDAIAALAQRQPGGELALGKGYTLLVRQKQLVHQPSGKSVLLTDKEIDILQMVAGSRGKVVPKEALLKTVWGIDSALDTHTLETHIYRLRGKFRELADDDEIIAADDGGYALVV